MPPNLVNFGPETIENGWRVFVTLYVFTWGDTANLTKWTLYNRQQVNFGMCYVVAPAYSLESQNVGRVHAGFAMHPVINVFVLLADATQVGKLFEVLTALLQKPNLCRSYFNFV